MKILRVHELPQEFDRLEIEALQEGHNFLTKMKREWIEGKNRFALDQEALFAAYSADGSLVGIGGLNRDPYVEDPTIGRVRHVFVTSSSRRSGVGAALLGAIIEEGQRHFRILRLRTQNPAAVEFYKKLGFVISDEKTDERLISLHMTLGTPLSR